MPKVAIGEISLIRLLQKLDDDENGLPSPGSKERDGRFVNVCSRCDSALGPPPWRCDACGWTPAGGDPPAPCLHIYDMRMIAEYPVSQQRETEILAAKAKPYGDRTNRERLLAEVSLAQVEVSHMQSTFISFGGPDEAFARRLHEALEANGVKTFFFPEHAVPGDKLHRVMRNGVNSYERVILICSEASLNRPGVLNELEETLQRESREGGADHLIPITIDDYVFTLWTPKRNDVAQAVRDRVVANFRGTTNDDAAFNVALQRLLCALRQGNGTL